jgi:hypothetical protein
MVDTSFSKGYYTYSTMKWEVYCFSVDRFSEIGRGDRKAMTERRLCARLLFQIGLATDPMTRLSAEKLDYGL